MTAPLVTIGLTTYNALRTLERALGSALAQTWRPIEIVAVDDGSSDGTLERLERVARQQPVLRVFSNAPNGGVAVSRNRILKEARGEFVVFFDDDDDSAPERIAHQVQRIVEYEDRFAGGAPVVCHTARRRIYTEGLERTEPTMGQLEGRLAPHGVAVANRILLGTRLDDGYGACPTCSQMARIGTYRAVGGFDPQLRRGEDTDFAIRLALAGGHFVGIAEPLVTQWMTRTSGKEPGRGTPEPVALDPETPPISGTGPTVCVLPAVGRGETGMAGRTQGSFHAPSGRAGLPPPRPHRPPPSDGSTERAPESGFQPVPPSRVTACMG